MHQLLSCVVVALVIGCGSPGQEPASSRPPLEEGTWEGGLTPMNHPEMVTPLQYHVAYEGGELTIDLEGPDGTVMPARGTTLRGDTLHFEFDEPDAGVTLRCALDRDRSAGFAGRCVDEDGKWARFTMAPPSKSQEL